MTVSQNSLFCRTVWKKDCKRVNSLNKQTKKIDQINKINIFKISLFIMSVLIKKNKINFYKKYVDQNKIIKELG